jgi:hypothetical protein
LLDRPIALPELTARLDAALEPLHFKRLELSIPSLPLARFWRSRKLLSTRVVALVTDDGLLLPGAQARELRPLLGEALGYVPILKTLEILAIVACSDFGDLGPATDSLEHSDCVALVSIHAVNRNRGSAVNARFESQRWITPIAEAIERAVREAGERTAVSEGGA